MARTGIKAVYIKVPVELADMWKLQAFIERRTVKDLIIDAMDRYMKEVFHKEGYKEEPHFEAVEELTLEDIENTNWEALRAIGIDVDVEELKKEIASEQVVG